MNFSSGQRSPGAKLFFAILIGILLAIPLFATWFIIYDREFQSETATTSITQGWGGPQRIAGPKLIIPYTAEVEQTFTEGNKEVVRKVKEEREFTVKAAALNMSTAVKPERRSKSIYEVIIYEAATSGQARFAIPADLKEQGVDPATLLLGRAELRFEVSDPNGLVGAPPSVKVAGQQLKLAPIESGFSAKLDASAIQGKPIVADFAFSLRGHEELSLTPEAEDTQWRVSSSWQHPSFAGQFLPQQRDINDGGFTASYRIGDLALSQPSGEETEHVETDPTTGRRLATGAAIYLVQPVDVYDQVSRAAKYGFLFIGFTFLAFLMFDVIAGVPVSSIGYLLVGAALVLFFLLLLAFAEVIGFTPAYLLASAAIIGLNTAYSAAVLKSWRRASFIGGLLTALYAVLYVLLSLEAYSLLIGSLMLFAALALVMYMTRNLNWGGRDDVAEEAI